MFYNTILRYGYLYTVIVPDITQSYNFSQNIFNIRSKTNSSNIMSTEINTPPYSHICVAWNVQEEFMINRCLRIRISRLRCQMQIKDVCIIYVYLCISFETRVFSEYLIPYNL